MKLFVQKLLRVLVSVISLVSFTFMLGAFGQDNAAIDSLENILRTAKTDTAKVNCLNALSAQYGKISGDFKMAMHYADSALDLAKTLDYKKGMATSSKYLGNCYDVQGNFTKALEHFLVSLEIFEEIGDKREAGFIYTNIGIVNLHEGNNPEALGNTLTALKIFEEIGDKEGLVYSYNSIGWIYERMSNYPEAIKYFSASMKICEEMGDKKGVGNAYTNIGSIKLNSGNYAEALEDYLTAVEIYEDIGYKEGSASCNNNIGWIYWLQGNYPEAIEYFKASLKISDEIGYYALTDYNYNCLVDINIDLNNFQEAGKYLDDRLALCNETGDKEGIVDSHIKIADIYHKQGNIQETRKYLNDALALSKEIGSKGQIRMIYNHLSILDSTEGNFEQSLGHYKMYTLYKDSLSNEESENQLAEMVIRYETEKKDREIELLNKDKALQEQKLEKQTIIRNGMIAGIFLIVLVGLLLFRSFRLRKKLEKQQAIIQERKRISSDLHDDVGSGLSRIMLLSEMMKKEAKTPESRKEAEKIAAISHELSANINEIVWALNSNNDYVENLVAYIRRYASEYFENSSVKLTINTPANIGHTHISGEHRRNIFYAVKEALHNIIKHAMATEARLEFTVKHNVLSIVINDNGKGFNEEELNKFGNGLNNMRSRMKNINGNCMIENHNGARITMTLPV